MIHDRLATIRVQRRSLATTIFIGTHLEHAEVLNLPSDNRKADESAIGFSRRLIADFDISSAGLEVAHNGDLRRTILSDLVIGVLRAEGIPVFRATKEQLFEAFGFPPLASRQQLAVAAIGLWPALNTRRFSTSVLDAAALGLYVQTERLFHD